MSEYFCKDCSNNNHGWCTIKKRNKLKEIGFCDTKNINIESSISKQITKPIDEDKEEDILLTANKDKQQQKQEDTEYLIQLLKDRLKLQSNIKTGLIPGSKIVNISLVLDNTELSTIELNIR